MPDCGGPAALRRDAGRLRLSRLPQDRMAALAWYALGSKAPLLERAAEPKRTAIEALVPDELRGGGAGSMR
ncbi:hypothetical protein ACWD6Q_33530 [Streptomyces nigra]